MIYAHGRGMSELPQNRPVARDKLSAALKRNMARRKVVASRQLSVVSEADSTMCNALREPLAAGGSRLDGLGGKACVHDTSHEASAL